MHADHYTLVARAIDLIRSADKPPSLEALAIQLDISAAHLQKVFTAWAGVSPKRFMQSIAKEAAKQALRQRVSVLEASLSAGMSGPGRLHDLLVQCDAVSPGEVGAHGEGLLIRHGIADTPFGNALIATTARGVCRVDFIDPLDATAAEENLQSEWPLSQLERDDRTATQTARQMFRGDARTPLRVLLRGTNFQIQVWQALLRLPCGSVGSYSQIAGLIGQPRAARAVGSAIAANALAWLIPCHRVIRADGDSGHYRWGATRKAGMLAWESWRTTPMQDE